MVDLSRAFLRKLCIRMTAVVLMLSSVFSLCSCSGDNGGFDGKRFSRTRKITVLTDSITDYVSDSTVDTSAAAVYIHDRLLNECNIDVRFIDSNMLDFHNGIAADISYTKNHNELATYYRMGSVIDLAPYLNEYSSALTDLTGLLGAENVYYCNSQKDEIWFLRPKDLCPDSRVTFIRRDWLDKLGLEEPSDIDELHDCLIAFRDNADLLLGNDADEMIPFLVDSEPNISAKPLFDSYLDASADDREIFASGYCRITQEGYSEGLRTLNKWYLEGLLPDDLMSVRRSSKEYYEPVEKGYAGAFCAKCDYLYANGEDSHIAAFRDNCGDGADYIAVNTFKDSNGNYVSWHEDYLYEDGYGIFMPSTCSDPLACLVYLNWISNSENIRSLKDLPADDPYTYDRYVLTIRDASFIDNLYDAGSFESACRTSWNVQHIHRGNLCVAYGPEVFTYIRSASDLALSYPGSAKEFTGKVITAGEGFFDSVYNEQYGIYLERGANILYLARGEEWDKVMVQGSREPRPL